VLEPTGAPAAPAAAPAPAPAATAATPAPSAQGLTLVHISAQRERFLWHRGCI